MFDSRADSASDSDSRAESSSDSLAELVEATAGPNGGLSPRALLITTVVVALITVGAVLGGLLYWVTPPLHAIPVPRVDRF